MLHSCLQPGTHHSFDAEVVYHRCPAAVSFIKRAMNRMVSKAWEEWQFKAAELRAQQYLLAGAIRRMLNRLLSRAWEKWQQDAQARRDLLAILRAAANKWRSPDYYVPFYYPVTESFLS